MPIPMSATPTVRTTRRPIRSVSSPPPIEPTTDARALTKKKTPTPASVWPKAGSIDRISDGTSRPVQPTSARPTPARTAAGSIRRGAGEAPRDASGSAGRVWSRHGSRHARAGSCSSSTAPTRRPRVTPATIARIEDQVRARGWDVTVVAPEWRRHSGPPARELEGRHPPPRPAVADARADPAGRPSPRRGHEDRDELLRGPARGAVRGDRTADAGRRHRLPRPPRVDPAGAPARTGACRPRRRRRPARPAGRPQPRRDRAGRPARDRGRRRRSRRA